MRVIKAIVLFCFSMMAVSACFEAPETSVIPKISFNKIQFKEVGTLADYDTLILTFDFQDGDGNLGLRADAPEDLEYPFHSAVYYIGDGLGDTSSVIPFKVDNYTVLAQTVPPTLPPGKIVTSDTRTQNPAYTYLPIYDPQDCLNYSDSELLIEASLNYVDGSFNIIDTVQLRRLSDSQLVTFYLVRENLLYKSNPNHNNIEIKFYIFQGGQFVEFDFFETYCLSFDGRFPVIGKNGTAVEGTFRYAMPNTSFVSVFGSNTIRITARIRDRALNASNLMVYEFELDDIR